MSDMTPETGARMLVEYTNYRGETARRVIVPVRFWWGKTEWHPEDQWLLHAWDAEKEAYRDFAFQDMRPIPNDATSSAISAQAARIADLDRQLAEARTDADQAVVLMWQQCFDLVGKYRSSSNYLSLACGDLEKIKPTDALAEVKRMRKERDDRNREMLSMERLSIERRDRAEAAEADGARLREALTRIVEWSDAYPTQVFPDPDFARAAAALSAAGMSLDVVSASNMRHAMKGVGEIARAAIKGDTP